MHCLNLIFVVLHVLIVLHESQGQTHADAMAILKDKMNSSVYNIDVRPIKDQSKSVKVATTFEILSIIEVDEVSQSFVCNGIMGFAWVDEVIRWDPADYGGHQLIHPKARDIWRPRVVLINTLGDRDIFEDDYAPTFIDYTGFTTWLPGSLFSTSCQLDMTNYPFDKQRCEILLLSMGYNSDEVQYVAADESVRQSYYTPNGEWELTDSTVETQNRTNQSNGKGTSAIFISFTLKRNPTYLLINIILPVVFLSALNLLVFIIPVESGEKISYGITVLLALSVFLSIVSGMLPRSSNSFPKVTVYLFILLILSVLTVIDSILIVYLHHKEEKVSKRLRVKRNFQSAVTKATYLQRAVSPVEKQAMQTTSKLRPWSADTTSLTNKRWPYIHNENGSSRGSSVPSQHEREQDGDKENGPNKYKLIGNHIDFVSFVVFTLLWITVTIGFMADLASG